MPDSPKNLLELKTLYEEGLSIFRTNNLFGIVDHIPTSDEPGFSQDFSYSQFLKQVVNFSNYSPWFQKITKYFDTHNLNYVKFEMVLYDVDSRKDSRYPGAVFKRALNEVDKMISAPNHYQSYKLATRKPLTYDEITFRNGRITQGVNTHQYQDTHAIELLTYLWDKREFRRPDNSVANVGELVPFLKVMSDLRIKSEDGVKATSEAINKSARLRKIGLRVTYPRSKKGIKLTVTQDHFDKPETV